MTKYNTSKDVDYVSLVKAAKQGDSESWELLLKKFDPLLNKCTHGVSPNNKEDHKAELTAEFVQSVQRFQFRDHS
ncbi:helix-turn-helix domain-containing protein [Lentibacillus sp. N15]|uniref:helix-turn-helix domain-containing protein n=1 Tax=Lentibacillus songyuanensis TaxID=3136161 RepID=UPI0031BA9B24